MEITLQALLRVHCSLVIKPSGCNVPCSTGLLTSFPRSINQDPWRVKVYRLGAPKTLGNLRPYQDPLLTVLGCRYLMCSALEPTRFQHRESEKLRNAETWMEDP